MPEAPAWKFRKIIKPLLIYKKKTYYLNAELLKQNH